MDIDFTKIVGHPGIETLKVLGSGFYNQNALYFLKDSGQEYVLKIYSPSLQATYENEVKSLKDLQTDSFFSKVVPRVYKSGQLDDSRYYVLMSKLPGTSLDQAIENMSPENLKGVAEDISRFWQGEREFSSVGYKKDSSATLLEQAFIRNFDKLGGDTWEKLGITRALQQKWLTWAGQAGDPEKLSLITQDFRLRHLLYSDQRISGLVDFEYMKHNDIALEIGHCLHDLLLLNTSASRRLFGFLWEKVIPDCSPKERYRIYLYMMKQGLGNIASKVKRGLKGELLTREIGLVTAYAKDENVDCVQKGIWPIPLSVEKSNSPVCSAKSNGRKRGQG